MKKISLFFLLFIYFGIACSTPPSSTSDQVMTEVNPLGQSSAGDKMTLLCRCGKGYVSASGKTEVKAQELAKRRCSAVSQSIGKCELKK